MSMILENLRLLGYIGVVETYLSLSFASCDGINIHNQFVTKAKRVKIALAPKI